MGRRSKSPMRRSKELSRNINKRLSQLRKTGGDLYGAWQGSFPLDPSLKTWENAPNVCQMPGMASEVFKGGRKRSKSRSKSKLHKRHGGNLMSETYFGRPPIGYYGPARSPDPAMNVSGIRGGKRRLKKKSSRKSGKR